jgi:hypothetical protein
MIARTSSATTLLPTNPLIRRWLQKTQSCGHPSWGMKTGMTSGEGEGFTTVIRPGLPEKSTHRACFRIREKPELRQCPKFFFNPFGKKYFHQQLIRDIPFVGRQFGSSSMDSGRRSDIFRTEGLRLKKVTCSDRFQSIYSVES